MGSLRNRLKSSLAAASVAAAVMIGVTFTHPSTPGSTQSGGHQTTSQQGPTTVNANPGSSVKASPFASPGTTAHPWTGNWRG
jgi:hypothetical protein